MTPRSCSYLFNLILPFFIACLYFTDRVSGKRLWEFSCEKSTKGRDMGYYHKGKPNRRESCSLFQRNKCKRKEWNDYRAFRKRSFEKAEKYVFKAQKQNHVVTNVSDKSKCSVVVHLRIVYYKIEHQ